MRQIVTVNGLKDLRAFQRDFTHLVDVVRQADGAYVLYVDIDRGIGAKPSIISKADFDRVVSPAMHRAPSAFSDSVAGGRFLPEKLNEAHAAIARETMKLSILHHGEGKILNRREYLAYYYGMFDFYPAKARILNPRFP